MSGRGYISLYRRIQEHWLWKDKPFSRGQAFIDLLLSVNHSDNKTVINNELVEVRRGSLITSQEKLSERWGWSRSKVSRFLKLLEDDRMIEVKTDSKKTTVNIVNYSQYQTLENIKRTSKKQRSSNGRTSNEHQTNTNNNENNDNNENNGNNIPPLPPTEQSPAKRHFAEFVTMTNDEYQSLIARYGKQDTSRLIEILDNYKGSQGKRYKSDYRAILSWCVKRLEEEKQKHRSPSETSNPFLDMLREMESEENG